MHQPSLVVSVTVSHQSFPGSNPTANKFQIFKYFFSLFLRIYTFHHIKWNNSNFSVNFRFNRVESCRKTARSTLLSSVTTTWVEHVRNQTEKKKKRRNNLIEIRSITHAPFQYWNVRNNTHFLQDRKRS